MLEKIPILSHVVIAEYLMSKYNRDWLITEIAKRASFTKKDVAIILDTIVEIFTEIVLNNDTLSVYGLGKLYTQFIGERKGSKGQMLPATNRSVFKLAEGIRFAQQRERKQIS